MGVWLLQDSPIFWFTGAPVPPPPVRPPVMTTYDLGGFNLEHIAPKLTEAEEQAIWRGDQRYYPGALPGGPPR